MGHSRAQKAETHERIVKLAAKRFREKGLAGIGIAELMKQAGLTVGGFYKHFASRDELVAEAMRSALAPSKLKNAEAGLSGAAATYSSVVDNYLSEAHRDHPGTGCAVGALAGEVVRADKQTRALVTQEVQSAIEFLANLIREGGEKGDAAARAQAVLTYCALIGAISVARGVADPKLSREILKSVAQVLKKPAQRPNIAS